MRRHFLASTAVVLFGAVPALALDRTLPPSSFGPTSADTLVLRRPGSTGPIDGMSVKPSGALMSLSLSALFSDSPPIASLGIDMTGVADSTANFVAALNSGKRIFAPCGTIRLVSTAAITARANFIGSGTCTVLKYDAPAGSAAAPVLDIQKTAVGSRFENFAFDHQANTKGFKPTTIYGGNIIAGSAVMIQADDTTLTNVTGRNGYDNCIAVVQFIDTGYNPQNGSPKRYSIQGARTFACGVGSTPKAGAGVDIGTGSQGTVNDLVDVGSYGAFILDIGAGAQGTFTNLTGVNTAFDPALGYSYTFYIGSTNSSFANLYSIGAGYSGIWIDGPATQNTFSNINIKAPANKGALLKGGYSVINGLIVNSPGFGKPPGNFDAVELDSSANTLNSLIINGLSVQSEFNTARYGINQTGGGVATGAVLNASFVGAAAATNNLSLGFGVVDGVALGGGWPAYVPTVTCDGGGALAAVASSGAYRLVGKTADFQANITITDKGTCTGSVRVGLPFQTQARVTFPAVESQLTGAPLTAVATAASSTVLLKKADGSTPANGSVLTLSGTYLAQ
jgi:hypothetical protein